MQCTAMPQQSFVSFEDMGVVSCPSPTPVKRKNNLLFPHQFGSVDSTCSSWPGSVWRHEQQQQLIQDELQQQDSFSKYWLESDFNNNDNDNKNVNSRERVSVSSVSSDCSTDEFFLISDEENLNTYSAPSAVEEIKTQSPPVESNPSDKEDLNNNSSQNANNNKNDNNSSLSSNNNKKKTSEKTKARLYDDDGYIRRAACVCLDETESKVLLVSSKDKCSWMVPGGGMEAGEEMSTAAIREAWEEAGVQGRITKYLGLFETNHKGGQKKHRTGVFVVSVKNVLEEYPEAYLGRRRQWFTIEEALLHLARTRPLQGAYLQLLLVSHLKVAAT